MFASVLPLSSSRGQRCPTSFLVRRRCLSSPGRPFITELSFSALSWFPLGFFTVELLPLPPASSFPTLFWAFPNRQASVYLINPLFWSDSLFRCVRCLSFSPALLSWASFPSSRSRISLRVSGFLSYHHVLVALPSF